MSSFIELVDVRKTYGSGASAVHAVDGISLTAERGEWLAIMGPSGSGKTTLINILGGLDHPSAGSVVVDGLEIGHLGERELTRYRADKIGFVFQQFHLIPYLTALENVMLSQYFHSITDEKEAAQALARVGLRERLNHVPSELSGGEQQRVAIARALINQPKLILADEPTGNLDEANEAVVLKLLHELHDAGHTILVVTHSQAIGNLADRRVELEHGRLARISVPSLAKE
jgi:putative ABC transport system ATP-binding protein